MSGAASDRLADAVAAQRGKIAALLDRLAEIGRDPPGITRHAYGEREDAAHALAVEEARRLGLGVAHDAAANLYLTWPGADRAAPRVLLGSHFDSVRQGGNFDGAAGVVAALAAVAAAQAAGVTPRADVTIAAFRCEEAVWFGLGLIGSRAALGLLPREALAAPRADTGETLAAHIRRSARSRAPIRPAASGRARPDGSGRAARAAAPRARPARWRRACPGVRGSAPGGRGSPGRRPRSGCAGAAGADAGRRP